jgi:hypothetical protein
MDLPLVCEIGMEHVLLHPERERIGFLAGDARRDPLPAGCDLVSFKSMLHDWPEAEAQRFVARAVEALEPGGSLLVFERAALDVAARPPSFGQLPVALFFRSYRAAGSYRRMLEECGLLDLQVQELALDVPFLLVTGRKPA